MSGCRPPHAGEVPLALARGWMDHPDSSIVVKVDAFECTVRLSLAPGFATERAAAAALVEDWAARGETPAMRARAYPPESLTGTA